MNFVALPPATTINGPNAGGAVRHPVSATGPPVPATLAAPTSDDESDVSTRAFSVHPYFSDTDDGTDVDDDTADDDELPETEDQLLEEEARAAARREGLLQQLGRATSRLQDLRREAGEALGNADAKARVVIELEGTRVMHETGIATLTRQRPALEAEIHEHDIKLTTAVSSLQHYAGLSSEARRAAATARRCAAASEAAHRGMRSRLWALEWAATEAKRALDPHASEAEKRLLKAAFRAAVAAVERQRRALQVAAHWVRARADQVRIADAKEFAASVQVQLATTVLDGVKACRAGVALRATAFREEYARATETLYATDTQLLHARNEAAVAEDLAACHEEQRLAAERAVEGLRVRAQPPRHQPGPPRNAARR